jgi:RimJ/RimL family protein N-acetyltransferase
MIRLIDVYSNDIRKEGAEDILYDLLKERDPAANISHQEMPTMEEHRAFVRKMPYRHWYLIQRIKKPEWLVGAIYLTNQREVGIAIFKKHQGKGYGTEAMKLMMEKHPGKFYANISPHNPKSVQFFKQFGIKLIQNTFELES